MTKNLFLLFFFPLVISCSGNQAELPQETVKITATQAAKITATQAATPTVSATETATPVATETATPVATETATPVATETATPVVTETATPVATPIATPTATPIATQTAPQAATAQAQDSGSVSASDIQLYKEKIEKDPSICIGAKGILAEVCKMGPPPEQAHGSDNSAPPSDDAPPALQNLLVLNFGPYDAASATSGDFRFIPDFPHIFFDEFGRVHSAGTPQQYDNVTFEYRMPRDTKLYSPIDGVIDRPSWQPTASYKQDDWEFVIKPWRGSKWAIVIDHVVSITCDRAQKEVCDDPLVINGRELVAGAEVKAGDLLGYVGNYESGLNGADAYGRTELTLGEYVPKGTQMDFMNYCPTNYLHPEVRDQIHSEINQFMANYELWAGDTSVYDEKTMVAPGCRYTKIYEESDGSPGSTGKTTPYR